MTATTAASRLFGPRRLILIQSGKYDYAELDLTQSFQLVGVNGLGKTALISTLQYLYLDNQRDMRFGQHSTDDSRRFYFKGEASFILFECETSLGTVTVGARSLGAVAGYELQRFVWNGAYDRADFIDERNRPRAWDEVRATLATKQLRVMADTAELRRLLGAVDEETNASWELVPLADSRDYPRFRQTFQRLLQLKDIRQDDLKHLLADCAKLSPAEREIDLAKVAEKELTKINRDRVEVAALRAAVARVKEARGLYDQEYVARAIAHAATQEMQARYAGYAAWFKSETEALYAVRDAAEKEFIRLEGEQKTLQQTLKESNQAAGRVKAKLEAIAEGRRSYADFVLEVEEQVRDRLSDEMSGLKMRLADVPTETIDVLTRQLGEQKTQISQRQATLAAIDQLFITWLRSRLPEVDIARVGSLLDRRVLESKLDEQVTIQNEAELLRRLRGAASRCDLPESLLEVIRITRERCNQARSRATQLAGTMGLLDKDFLNPTFRYDHAAPVVDRLSQLEAEIASLDERAQNIETRWLALLTDARSSFATMLKSLRAVTRQAQKLTGELGKIEFSSLAEVRLEIVPNAAAVSEYERHSKDSAQPSLFDTAEEADRKMSQFSQLLQRRPKLLLNELFSLRCDVRRKDGQRNSYDNFDEVESTGTTVVLKVTLNLLVLRDLLVPGKARIPYYLDEVHALDRQNFGNILQLSERLGFIGIYAAPTAAVGPRRFVHLVPDAKGRLVVTAAHRKDILRSPDDVTPTGEERHG